MQMNLPISLRRGLYNFFPKCYDSKTQSDYFVSALLSNKKISLFSPPEGSLEGSITFHSAFSVSCKTP